MGTGFRLMRRTETLAKTKLLVIILACVLLIVMVSGPHLTRRVGKDAPVEEFIAYLDEQVRSLMQHYSIPGAAIALVYGGEIQWTNAFGYGDLHQQRAMTVDTPFRVESISKSVAAWGIMKLVEQGKLQLDVPVNSYLVTWQLPKSDFAEENITVRQLLSNSAGMPLGDIEARYSPGDSVPSLQESLSKEIYLQQQPGTSFSYSNTGYNLLELLVQDVSGRTFSEYMQSEVLLPLDMSQSSFSWREELAATLPFGYTHKGTPVAPYVYPGKASGGLFSTVRDIARFVCAGMGSANSTGLGVLSPEAVSQLYAPAVDVPGLYGLAFDSYGFGHFVEDLPGVGAAVSHGGQGHGWMTHFHSVPDTGDGIVILSNSQRSWPFFANVISSWAEWRGFPSVGMSRILLGQKALWVLIGILLCTALWQAWNLGERIVQRRCLLAPLSRNSRPLRLLQGFLCAALLLILGWAMNQKYFFLTSLFPIAASWLGIAVFALAIVLLLSALLPQTR